MDESRVLARIHDDESGGTAQRTRSGFPDAAPDQGYLPDLPEFSLRRFREMTLYPRFSGPGPRVLRHCCGKDSGGHTRAGLS